MSKFNSLLAIIITALSLTGAVWAQDSVAASSSNLTGILLPANAQRVLPSSVPAEVSGTLGKMVEAGNGKLQQGDSEVLAWADAGYRKANAPAIINKLRANLQAKGWQYEVGGEESGVTVFSASKDGTQRRAIVGFYAATDEALLLAWTEILLAGTSNNSNDADVQPERAETVAAKSNGGDLRELVGKWGNGNVSMLQEKNLTTGQITSSNGSIVSYKFYPDGRFEHIGYLKSTMYGCTTDLFNDKRGKFEVSGDKITLVPSKNYWKNTYSCSPASNKERNYVLDRETYTFRFKTDDYGKAMICLTSAKGTESCYRREE